LAPVERFNQHHKIHATLDAMPWFESCRSELKVKVLSGARLVNYVRGETVLNASDLQGQYFGVLNGLLTLQSTSISARASVFGALCANDWFGNDIQIRRSALPNFDIVALRNTEVVILQSYAIEAIALECQSFNQFTSSQLALRFEQALDLIHIERTTSVEERLAYFLNSKTLPPYKGIKLSQEEMGLFTGLSRQSVNKAWQAIHAKSRPAQRVDASQIAITI
jgi:CRP/FNR family transcriptional regulator, cyclic AMP receptor protein